MERKIYRALGLMSGTSIDGIDAALIETDGIDQVTPLAFLSQSYDNLFREKLRSFLGRKDRLAPDVIAFEQELTEQHASVVRRFLVENLLTPDSIDLIGFHGQTVWHEPKVRLTVQLGDGALLAKLTGIPVVNDFRTADVLSGGNGAPLVPLYHRALSAELPKPVAIINIGGVSNITWIGGEGDDEILAFDLGPGNALLDDWVLRHTGRPYDEFGQLAAEGKADTDVVARFLRHPYFSVKPPKSLDRDAFTDYVPSGLNAADGAATLTLVTVWAIVKGFAYLPKPPVAVYLTGGGRHNLTMMRWIAELSGLPVTSVDDLGWSGDGLEAEAFGYLGVRSRLGLPLSLPLTTGVEKPMTGGRYYVS